MKKSNKDTGCHNGKNSRKYGRENAGYFKDVSARTKECDKSENKCGTEKRDGFADSFNDVSEKDEDKSQNTGNNESCKVNGLNSMN